MFAKNALKEFYTMPNPQPQVNITNPLALGEGGLVRSHINLLLG